MRKVWVSKESIYPKPFYRSKFKLLGLAVAIFTCVFFSYQFLYLSKLESTSTMPTVLTNPGLIVRDVDEGQPAAAVPHQDQQNKIIKGIRLRDLDLYSPKFSHLFRCIQSGKEIPFDRVNDEYCDCPEDGSDEPSTAACPNGHFYCTFQHRHKTGRGAYVAIPSGRVNDGICDCCDGSDEWNSPGLCPRICR